MNPIPRAIALLFALSGAGLAFAAGEIDHREFDATLHVPYRAAAGAIAEARSFTLSFAYPLVEHRQIVSWRVELLDPVGAVVQRWYGVETLFGDEINVNVDWAGRQVGMAAVDGVYQVRLTATSRDATPDDLVIGVAADFVEKDLAAPDLERIEQSWDTQVGTVAPPAMPAFSPLATPASLAAASRAQAMGAAPTRHALSVSAGGGLPYTVYLANLHSQTGHSDGGGTIGNCSGAQSPQAHMNQAPAQAYQYAMDRGLDILMTSEHNHMFDGSDGTNTSQTPAYAKSLFQSGLSAATNFNAAHPNFLAIYGMEWGVISNGGHMNIFNSNELFGWEYNAKGELLADTYTEKNNYGALYTLMAQRGLVGQFNHPDSSAFKVGGVAMGYSADGEKAMALCEVMNTNAFSNSTTESDNGNSGYEASCKKALEAGFKVAFATNQDNHCANWGASSPNRNGILIPNGTALTQASFIEAVKARRVFATMDKTSQLILTANGRLMGETFTNAGPLSLVANYAPGPGRAAATVKIYEGVPRRNGTVTELSSVAVNNFTPAIGAHFYYAKVTQTDGKILWSAPVWVNQTADTTPPTVSASVTGTGGTLGFAASASDNVGVTRVEYFVDGSLAGKATVAPYALAFASTGLANGAHILRAMAYDAASNVGSSGDIPFTVSNAVDVTAQLRITASGLSLNRATQLYTGTITLTSATALSGPLQLELGALPAGVNLSNASGLHNGKPYISLGEAGLTPGVSRVIPVSFSNPSKASLVYTTQVYAGTF